MDTTQDADVFVIVGITGDLAKVMTFRPMQPYRPGTRGPAAADKLVSAYGLWREPWTATS